MYESTCFHMYESLTLSLASLWWSPHLSDIDLAVSPTYLMVGSPLTSTHCLQVDSYIRFLLLQFSGFLAIGHARHFLLPHGLVSQGFAFVRSSFRNTPLLSNNLTSTQ